MNSTLDGASCPGVGSHAHRVHRDCKLGNGVHQDHTRAEGGQQTLNIAVILAGMKAWTGGNQG